MEEVLRLKISIKDKEALQQYAWRAGMSMSLVVRMAIRKYVNSQELPSILQEDTIFAVASNLD